MTYDKPLPCKCGADARIRCRDPYVWIECKKKCGMITGYFIKYLSDDVGTERNAVEEWNRKVQSK